MHLNSIISSNVILHIPGTDSNQNATKHIPPIFFFITGNPGLIGYYTEYLGRIAHTQDHAKTSRSDAGSNPSSTEQLEQKYIVAGFSLGGFDIPTHDESEITHLLYPESQRKEIYGLTDQIELSYARLKHLCRLIRRHYENDRPIEVTLAGHSVGAYIALEMVRLHHLRSKDPSYDESEAFPIRSALLLTPTIIDLAASASGRIATPVLSIPGMPGLVQFAAASLGFMSRAYLDWIVSKATGMKNGSAGLRCTASFLVSAGGVRQALYMARDELADMRGDKWGDEIWGYTKALGNENKEKKPWQAPKLFFLFAEKDHWVADVTRDNIVKGLQERHGVTGISGDFRPEVIVDREHGLVHAWCLEQSEFVADVTRKWLQSLYIQR